MPLRKRHALPADRPAAGDRAPESAPHRVRARRDDAFARRFGPASIR